MINKALVLNERGHPFFFPPPFFFFFFFFFLKNKFASSRNKSVLPHTGLQSPGNVITVRFLPQDEDWWLTRRRGQKSDEERDL